MIVLLKSCQIFYMGKFEISTQIVDKRNYFIRIVYYVRIKGLQRTDK